VLVGKAFSQVRVGPPGVEPGTYGLKEDMFGAQGALPAQIDRREARNARYAQNAQETVSTKLSTRAACGRGTCRRSVTASPIRCGGIQFGCGAVASFDEVFDGLIADCLLAVQGQTAFGPPLAGLPVLFLLLGGWPSGGRFPGAGSCPISR
jgi:hypothetical protein